MMKKIEAYVQPAKVEEIQRALAEAGIPGMTVYPVRGFARQRGYTPDETPGAEAKLLEKMKIEIFIEEEQVDRIVQMIVNLAQTGTIGAGKVFVTPVEDAVRIATREAGWAALR